MFRILFFSIPGSMYSLKLPDVACSFRLTFRASPVETSRRKSRNIRGEGCGVCSEAEFLRTENGQQNGLLCAGTASSHKLLMPPVGCCISTCLKSTSSESTLHQPAPFGSFISASEDAQQCTRLTPHPVLSRPRCLRCLQLKETRPAPSPRRK